MRITLTIGILALAASVVTGFQEASPAEPSAVKKNLDQAIDDERHAIAFYAAVMSKHENRRPFANIIHAERRHESALLLEYERLGLTPPANQWTEHTFDVPSTFAEACDVSVVAEIRNVKMYDALIASTEEQHVRSVFERLRWASQERHLPAFRKHSNNWEPVVHARLNDQQKKQVDRADQARGEMFGQLFRELSSALEAGDPATAIEVCAGKAPVIADSTGRKRGVRIGRTSWKLRNTKNTIPVWAELAVDDRPEQPRYFADRNGRVGTLTPIPLAAGCLQCHGSSEQIAPATQSAIRRLYPDDQATGFAEGDLRGWFWVEVPALKEDQDET